MTPTPEALAPEERALIGSDTSNEDANGTHLARKLLRIHDQQAAALRELERKLMESYEENRDLRARNRELEPL
jgi:hypothetical protein